MATVNTQTAFPPLQVNAYVISQLEEFGIVGQTRGLNPIFPTVPSNIDEVYKNYIDAASVEDPLLIYYERLLRFRPTPFYRHKREQLMYYFYSTNMSKIYNANRVVAEALDREDAAAEDLNSWLAVNEIPGPDGNPLPNNVFFHNMRVYQADEVRDLIELSAARTIYINKLIIEYDYHTTDSFYN